MLIIEIDFLFKLWINHCCTELTEKYETLLLTLSVLKLIVDKKFSIQPLAQQQRSLKWPFSLNYRFLFLRDEVEQGKDKSEVAGYIFKHNISYFYSILQFGQMQIDLIISQSFFPPS